MKLAQIEKAGKSVGKLHASNSPALLNVDGVSLDAVRIGSAFTGRVITKNKNLRRLSLKICKLIVVIVSLAHTAIV